MDAGDPVDHQLGGGTVSGCDHGRSRRERFDNHAPECFVEFRRKHQARRLPEQGGDVLRCTHAEPGDPAIGGCSGRHVRTQRPVTDDQQRKPVADRPPCLQ